MLVAVVPLEPALQLVPHVVVFPTPGTRRLAREVAVERAARPVDRVAGASAGYAVRSLRLQTAGLRVITGVTPLSLGAGQSTRKARVSNFRSTQVCARALVAGVVLALAGLVGGARAAAPPYVAVDLQSAGGDFGIAVALNNEAQVVGTGNLSAGHQPRAFSWTQSGGMVGLGDQTDEAVAVNDSGQVAAQRDEFSGLPRAYLWTASDGLVDIGVLGAPPPCPTCPHSGPRVTATDLNEAGEIVGISTTANGEFHAFVWSRAGGMVDLGTLGGTDSSAEAINDPGQVVGESMTAARESHPFSWTRGGGMIDLGTLGPYRSRP